MNGKNMYYFQKFNNNSKTGILIYVLISFVLAFNMNLIGKTAINNEISILENGEVITKSLTSQLKNNLKGAEARIFINSPPEKVWNLLDNQEKLPEIITRLKKVKVLERTETTQKVQTAIKVSNFLPLFRYVLLLDQSEKYKKIKFTKVEGAFNKLYGAWELEPHKNGTILTYKMFIDPGFFVPGFVCDSGLKKDLPEVLNAIKYSAEKS